MTDVGRTHDLQAPWRHSGAGFATRPALRRNQRCLESDLSTAVSARTGSRLGPSSRRSTESW